MAPRSDRRNVQRRGKDDHPPWVNDDHPLDPSYSYSIPYTAIATPQRPTPTDGDDDDYNHGPPSSWIKPSTISTEATASTEWSSRSSLHSTTLAIVPSSPSSRSPPVTITETQTAQTPTPFPVVTTSQEAVTASAPAVATITATIATGHEGGEEAGGMVSNLDQEQHPNRVGMYAAAGVGPIVVLAIIGFFVIICARKRRKERQVAAAQALVKEMKFQPPTMQTYSVPAVPLTRAPSYTAPSTDPPVLPLPSPVILGPIDAGSNSAYMTGIDTSDVMSTRDVRTGLGDPFADGSSMMEEPPPPYKPRSLASRNNSVRIPRSSLSMSSQRSAPSYTSRVQPLGNPFEDPREDDAVSQISDFAPTNNRDNMSAVSDLSYQRYWEVGRQAR